MNLCRLIYTSYATPNLVYQDLKDIMEKSQINNKANGITGFLCYSDSMFLQVLEGDRANVSNTYHRIAKDPRHHSPVLIECVPIEHRFFGLWSMKVIKLGSLNKEQINNLILKYSSSVIFEPNLMTPSQCMSFIQELDNIYQSLESTRR